jgi:hypothetical protein
MAILIIQKHTRMINELLDCLASSIENAELDRLSEYGNSAFRKINEENIKAIRRQLLCLDRLDIYIH